MSDGVEKHIDKQTLTNLYNADMVSSRKQGEERATIASKIKNYEESHNLDRMCYGIVKRLAKLPDGLREKRLRTLMLYIDHLELVKQRDLFETVKNSDKPRTEMEKELDAHHGVPRDLDGDGEDGGEDGEDGEGSETVPDRADAGSIGSILRPNTAAGKRELGKFVAALKDAGTADAVNKGLERFTTDHPALATAAADAAKARILEIDREAGGGEDLRPKALREAATTEAGQIASDAKAKARQSTRSRKGGGSASTTAAVH